MACYMCAFSFTEGLIFGSMYDHFHTNVFAPIEFERGTTLITQVLANWSTYSMCDERNGIKLSLCLLDICTVTNASAANSLVTYCDL